MLMVALGSLARRAEAVVVDVAGELRAGLAVRAVRVGLLLEVEEARAECVVDEEASDERGAEVEEDLDRLDGLQGADDAGEDAEDAGFGARWSELGRRGLGEQAAVARAPAFGRPARTR